MTLVYLVVLVALFALAYGLLGWASPRRYQVKVARSLPAAPERVWSYLAEPSHWPHWFPHVTSCEHVGGPASGVGQRRRVRFEHGGAAGEREEQATTWDEPRLLVLEHGEERLAGKPEPWTDAKWEFRLAPDAGGTMLTGVLWFSGRGAMGRALSLLSIRKRHEREMRQALANLETRLRDDEPDQHE